MKRERKERREGGELSATLAELLLVRLYRTWAQPGPQDPTGLGANSLLFRRSGVGGVLSTSTLALESWTLGREQGTSAWHPGTWREPLEASGLVLLVAAVVPVVGCVSELTPNPISSY